MDAREAIDRLDPEKWAATPPGVRLALLEQVRDHLREYRAEVAASDTRAKNNRLGEVLYDDSVSAVATAVPLAYTIAGCIELYGHLAHGQLPAPLSVRQVADDEYEIAVFPSQAKDRLMYPDRADYLRVRGEPRQTNPMDKPAGIISVLGAGNHSSPHETLKALFLENCAVVHKPHPLNIETDRVWAKILQPLVKHGVLSFLEQDPEGLLTTDPHVSRIYLTGSPRTARAILDGTNIELVSECGGNTPCLIVPGDRPWTAREIAHQADQLVTISKLNGGAVCGRVQTLVTCRSWPQRRQFLDAVRRAITNDTPAAGTYYPGADEMKYRFLEAYPQAEVLEPEHGQYRYADFVLIPDVARGSFATRHEAFCQVLSEVVLDTPPQADAFLAEAVPFCNRELLGTLTSCILIDEDTKAAHRASLDAAVTDLRYGSVAVNTMPPFIFLSPYLTWGGNEVGADELVSGRGNFGNVLCFDNVHKSVMVAGFMSPGHALHTNKTAFHHLADHLADYAIDPTWMNLTRLIGGVVIDGWRDKDF